ncbi:MAG: hypothetical protein KF789_14045 [Bdellovibrionaceae bacterium]|nr:hypothetical protein [Pseudobdellovibrionaceae bacterium]
MMREQVSVQYRGFHPSEFTESQIDALIKEIQAEAPHGATLKAVFSRKDFYVRGVISVQSSSGRFFAVASGRRLTEVTGQIAQKMRRQLHRWKSERIRRNRRRIEASRFDWKRDGTHHKNDVA